MFNLFNKKETEKTKISQELGDEFEQNRNIESNIKYKLTIQFVDEFWNNQGQNPKWKNIPYYDWDTQSWMSIYMYFELCKKLERLENLIKGKTKSSKSKNKSKTNEKEGNNEH